MTIEAQGTLPAGWYSDPAQSGGDRWWDGTGWTEHLRAPVHVEPVIAMPDFSAPATGSVLSPMTAPTPTAPVVSQAAPKVVVQPFPTTPPPSPTGPVALAPLAPIGQPPVVSSYEPSDLHGSALEMHFIPEVSNGSAALSFICGIVAVGLAAGATTLLPLPQVWVSAFAVGGMIFGIRALVRVRAQRASNRWAPVIGILLAIVAAASIFFGGAVMTLVSSVVPQQQQTSAIAPSAAPLELSAQPLVFPLNAKLTAQEK